MLEIIKHHSSFSVSDKTRYFESNNYQRVEEVQFQMMAKRSHRALKYMCYIKDRRERFEKAKKWDLYEIYNTKVQNLLKCEKYRGQPINFLIK